MLRHSGVSLSPGWLVLTLTLIVRASSPGKAADDDLGPLVQQLGSTDPFARLGAARRVAELGPEAAKATPALIEALKCERVDVLFEMPQIATSRRNFADALVKVGDAAVPELEQALRSENDLVRVWSAYALHRIDSKRKSEQVLSVLSAGLRQGNEAAGDAASILEHMGPKATPAIPVLIEQLANRDVAVRCEVAHALAAIVKGDQTRQLTQALQHRNGLVRVGAAFALQRVDSESSQSAQTAIEAALRDDSLAVRQQAVWAIGQLGAKPLANALVAALPKLQPDSREYFFGAGGPLSRQCQDPSLVLVAIGPECKPALVEALDSESPRARAMAAVALGRLDPAQADRVASVLKALREEPDPNLRFFAEMNYAPPGPASAKDLNGLIQELLEFSDYFRPSPAAGALIQRGPAAVEPLMEVLKRGDGLAAGKASNVLAAIGAPALPALRDAMQSDNDQLRVFTVGVLAQMGERALPELINALDDELYPVRRAARYALRSIDTPAAKSALEKLNVDR